MVPAAAVTQAQGMEQQQQQSLMAGKRQQHSQHSLGKWQSQLFSFNMKASEPWLPAI